MPRIGLLGGTFNPIHIGHLRLAIECLEQLDLDCVELLPCASPAHKSDHNLLPFEFRSSLIRAAIENNKFLRLNELEGMLSYPSYTYNTIQAWQAQNSKKKGIFIVGAEDFANLNSWYRGLELPMLMDFAVIARSNAKLESFVQSLQSFWPHITYNSDKQLAHMAENKTTRFLTMPMLDISASLLRDKWLNKQHINYILPEPCLELLKKHTLIVDNFWSKK